MDIFVVELRTMIDHEPMFLGGPLTRKIREWMFKKSYAVLPDPIDKMIVNSQFQKKSAIRWIEKNGDRVESDRMYWYAILEIECGEYLVSQQTPRIPKSRGYYDRHGVRLMKQPYGNS